MRRTKQTNIDTNNRTGPLDTLRPKSATALSEVADEFLHTRPVAETRDPELVYAVVAMANWLGSFRIDRVTFSDLQAALRCSHPVPQVRQRLVPGIQQLFRWSRAQGYLPAELPTPADQLEVSTPRVEPPILTFAEAKALLAGTEDVELSLASALVLFSGIRPWELEQLSWESIFPGFAIEVPLRRGQRRPTGARRVLPGLDAWLRPFYCSRGPVISPRTLRRRLRPLPRRRGIQLKLSALRHTFEAYYLGDTGNLDRIARKLGVITAWHRHPLLRPATEAEARQFFALTPAAVGITDWPQRVAKYLKRRQLPRYRKLALPPTATTR
jgi:integrase